MKRTQPLPVFGEEVALQRGSSPETAKVCSKNAVLFPPFEGDKTMNIPCTHIFVVGCSGGYGGLEGSISIHNILIILDRYKIDNL